MTDLNEDLEGKLLEEKNAVKIEKIIKSLTELKNEMGVEVSRAAIQMGLNFIDRADEDVVVIGEFVKEQIKSKAYNAFHPVQKTLPHMAKSSSKTSTSMLS